MIGICQHESYHENISTLLSFVCTLSETRVRESWLCEYITIGPFLLEYVSNMSRQWAFKHIDCKDRQRSLQSMCFYCLFRDRHCLDDGCHCKSCQGWTVWGGAWFAWIQRHSVCGVCSGSHFSHITTQNQGSWWVASDSTNLLCHKIQ